MSFRFKKKVVLTIMLTRGGGLGAHDGRYLISWIRLGCGVF
jgi:hypothetical protein